MKINRTKREEETSRCGGQETCHKTLLHESNFQKKISGSLSVRTPTTIDIRSSRPEVLLEKGPLKICSKFTGEQPFRSVISVKLLCNTSVWVFSCKFAAYFQNTFSREHLWVVSSVIFYLEIKASQLHLAQNSLKNFLSLIQRSSEPATWINNEKYEVFYC